MQKINILPDNVVNQIAAGEVIENPASVIKELIDNALDAKATDIKIEIKNGGQQFIKVSDNGIGMNCDDLLLAIERHATSKLQKIDDLHTIHTMGFRGEALPSIASISKTTLTSTVKNDQNCSGNTILIEGGQIKYCKPFSRSYGTTIEVRSLFFNTPVRKKFLKSTARETTEIQRHITALALANPDIKFHFINNQKSVFSLKSTKTLSFKESLQQRLGELLNIELCGNAEYFNFKEGNFTIKGFLVKPSFTRPNRLNQYIYINRRPISSLMISYAVLSAYGTRLTTGRFPCFVLHLEIPGETIDINVHPQKKEVRFQEKQMLRDFIIRSISKSLSQQPPPNQPQETDGFNRPEPSFSKLSSWNLIEKNIFPKTINLREDENPVDFIIEETPDNIHTPNIVGILDRYILIYAQDFSPEKGLTFVDSREALRTILFNEILERYNKNNDIGVENLLIPLTIEFSPEETSLLKINLIDLNKMGISIREFGPNTFIVDALPQNLEYEDLSNFLHQVIENLNSPEKIFQEHSKALSLALVRASLPKIKNLTFNEAQTIIKKIFYIKPLEYSHNGKKIFATLGLQEIKNTLK